MTEQKGPVCSKCGHTHFEMVPITNFNMLFVCCAKCGEVIAYRDLILLDKLDNIAEELVDFKR